MEPLDTDFEYVVREPRQARNLSRHGRFNILLLFPALGVLWLLYLALSALFQWNISATINPILGFMIVVFIVLVLGLFWATNPNTKR